MADGNGRKVKAGSRPAEVRPPLPDVIAPTVDAPAIRTRYGSFDLDDLTLPDWIAERAFKSGGYPYDEPMKDKPYEKELELLQIELVKLQAHVVKTGMHLVAVFEGRDAAGKGGAILAFSQYLNPRAARMVALPKPTGVERGQWYFQRYIAQLPTAGEIVLFDRSWYNRAGVEPAMGFCTPAEHKIFLEAVSGFEKMLVDQGIVLFKYWLSIGREMQLKRFYERRHNPLKIWKLSPVDYAALGKWDEYTRLATEMFAASQRPATPWTVVKANDKRRARLNIIRQMLSVLDYEGKDRQVVQKPDPLIVGNGPAILGRK